MQISTTTAPKWKQAIFERSGFNSEKQLLDTFSTEDVTFTQLKKKKKGIFFGFILGSKSGRNYFVKEVSPLVPFSRDTQFIYHLGNHLGIKFPKFSYTRKDHNLFGVSAGLSRHENAKTYDYADYNDSYTCGCWPFFSAKAVYDETSIPSIARLVLLASLCEMGDLHRNNIGVVKSKRDLPSLKRKRKLAVVDFFATRRRSMRGLEATTLKDFLLSQFPPDLDRTAPELKKLLAKASENDLREAVAKFFTRFPIRIEKARRDMSKGMNEPKEDFVESLKEHFQQLSAWYTKLPPTTSATR